MVLVMVVEMVVIVIYVLCFFDGGDGGGDGDGDGESDASFLKAFQSAVTVQSVFWPKLPSGPQCCIYKCPLFTDLAQMAVQVPIKLSWA